MSYFEVFRNLAGFVISLMQTPLVDLFFVNLLLE